MLSLLIMMCGTAGMLCCMSLIGAGQSEEEQKERSVLYMYTVCKGWLASEMRTPL